MRIIFLSIIILMLLGLIGSCNKSNNRNRITDFSKSDDLKNEITYYLKTKKSKTTPSLDKTIDSVLTMVNWSSMKIMVYKNQEFIILSLNKLEETNLFLCLSRKKDDLYFNSTKIVFVRNFQTNQSALDGLINYFTNNVSELSGTFSFYTLTKEFLYEEVYDKGKLMNTKSIQLKQSNPNNINSSITNQTCYAVVLYTYWSDGSVTYEILFEYCVETKDGCAQRVYSIDLQTRKNIISSRCAGGGGSGSGGVTPIDTECSNNLTTFIGSSTASTIEKTTTYNSQELTERTYKWKFHTANTWYYFSKERGVLRKENNEWRFNSLTHIIHDREGYTIGGTLSLSSFSATPHVGIYNAIMELDYVLSASFICKGSPINISVSYRSANNFSSLR